MEMQSFLEMEDVAAAKEAIDANAELKTQSVEFNKALEDLKNDEDKAFNADNILDTMMSFDEIKDSLGESATRSEKLAFALANVKDETAQTALYAAKLQEDLLKAEDSSIRKM